MCRRLETSERLHRFIVNSSPDLIFILDAEGRFSYVNQRAKALLGFQTEALIGQSLLDLVVPADREKAAELLRDLADNPKELQRAELRLRRDEDFCRDHPTLEPLAITEVAALALSLIHI